MLVTQYGKLTASAVLLEQFPGCFDRHKSTSACSHAAHVPDTVVHRVHEAILSLGVTEVLAKTCERSEGLAAAASKHEGTASACQTFLDRAHGCRVACMHAFNVTFYSLARHSGSMSTRSRLLCQHLPTMPQSLSQGSF